METSKETIYQVIINHPNGDMKYIMAVAESNISKLEEDCKKRSLPIRSKTLIGEK